MANLPIKKALGANMVKQWQLAREMGICDMTLYRKLRNELPEQEQKEIIKLIEKIAAERTEVPT